MVWWIMREGIRILVLVSVGNQGQTRWAQLQKFGKLEQKFMEIYVFVAASTVLLAGNSAWHPG